MIVYIIQSDIVFDVPRGGAGSLFRSTGLLQVHPELQDVALEVQLPFIFLFNFILFVLLLLFVFSVLNEFMFFMHFLVCSAPLHHTARTRGAQSAAGRLAGQASRSLRRSKRWPC